MSNKQQPPPDDEDWGPHTPWQDPSIPPIQQPPPSPPRPQPQPQGWQGQLPRQTLVLQTYMVPAVLVTLFCFLPTGIAAIVFASQASSKGNVGDFEGATQASQKARLYVIVSLLAGLAFWVIVLAISLSTSSTTTSSMPAP